MLKVHTKVTALVACAAMWCLTMMPNASALSTGANPAMEGEALATLTAKQGTVWKQSLGDWNKDEWGNSQNASVNDRLPEGMRLNTGNESWAEVSWPNVKTRVWANSAIAIAPNKRLVYLTQGEMLYRLDKHRKDKDQDYFIWTKVLQARIRGTTVLVQSIGTVTRFTVMEGTVDLKNRLDGSEVTVKPGTVYEIIGYSGAQPDTSAPYKPKPLSAPKSLNGAVIDTLYDREAKMPVFQDSYASSNVYAANSSALMNHPLLKAGGDIDSLPLIEQEQQNLPGFNPVLPIKVAGDSKLGRTIAAGISVQKGPSKVDYFTGQMVGKLISTAPTAFGNLPPRGVILSNVGQLRQTEVAHGTPTVAPPPMVVMPLPGGGGLITDTTAAEAKVEQPLPVQEFTTPRRTSNLSSTSQPAPQTDNVTAPKADSSTVAPGGPSDTPSTDGASNNDAGGHNQH